MKKDLFHNAILWLLSSEDPSIRYFTLTDLLEKPVDSKEAQEVFSQIPQSPRVKTLLSGQESDGSFGVHPYKKWYGAHWRLVSLVELGIPPGFSPAVRATDDVLHWLTGEEHKQRIKVINGLTRRCASQEGNCLLVCCKLGLAQDHRVKELADNLIRWQWPDGGWNCDKKIEAHHSSFYESLIPLWGLIEYHKATDDKEALLAAYRTAEFFLRHHLFRSEKTGEIINPEWLKLHYPVYWHYDILQALRILSYLDKLSDPRTKEALDILENKQLSNGKWKVEGRYWKSPGVEGSNVEVVDWGDSGPNEFITLNALRVLKSAGRLTTN